MWAMEALVRPSQGDVTSLLNQVADGDRGAEAKLVPLIYDELRRLATRRLRHERRDHTLQTTALVHEAYLKLVGQRDVKWQNRTHFFAVASQAMRRILVDYARAQQTTKRGGKLSRVALDDVCVVSHGPSVELVAVDESLARLEKLDPRQAQIVELRYFGGMSVDETAEALGISAKTVIREWNVAKAWLFGDLKERNADNAAPSKEGKGAV
jgi:RNA polymerase sigma factor (TIGR02999 family)